MIYTSNKAKIVQKCGTRDYWENWAADIAKIAETHINNLNSLLVKRIQKKGRFLKHFLKKYVMILIRNYRNRRNRNVGQHIITKPVFETLFSGNDFSKENAVSKAIEKVLSKVYKDNIEKENISLKIFIQVLEDVQKTSLHLNQKQSYSTNCMKDF